MSKKNVVIASRDTSFKIKMIPITPTPTPATPTPAPAPEPCELTVTPVYEAPVEYEEVDGGATITMPAETSAQVAIACGDNLFNLMITASPEVLAGYDIHLAGFGPDGVNVGPDLVQESSSQLCYSFYPVYTGEDSDNYYSLVTCTVTYIVTYADWDGRPPALFTQTGLSHWSSCIKNTIIRHQGFFSVYAKANEDDTGFSRYLGSHAFDYEFIPD